MFILSSAFVVAVLLAQEPIILVDEGLPAAVIVVADDASPTVRRAADEVARYLQKMSGAAVPVFPEHRAPQGIRIDVGSTQNALNSLPDDILENDERVVVRKIPDGVVICGGSDRATLYAAYRFLESLGCRWLTPEPGNEAVPQMRSISIDKLNIDTSPAFTWRMFNARSSELEQWGLKLGFNGLYPPQLASTNGHSFYWPSKVPGVHAFADIIPASRYFSSHPEWFPFLNGKRIERSASVVSQLCVTAPGLPQEFAANVIEIFNADPAASFISISPNDGYGWCECPNCKELDERLSGSRMTTQGLAEEQPFVGDRLYWFANQVSRRVAERFPERKLLMLSYINYAEPPDSVDPENNIIPFVCHYAPADYSRSVADPSSEANRQFDNLLQRWLVISPDLMIYSYVSKSMWWRLPRPVLEPFAADVKYYHQLGIRRYYCQSTLSDWAADGPLYYVIARLLWDPKADPAAIADEWIDGMFGPAAAEMKNHYAAVAQSVRATGKPYSDDPPGQVPGLFNRAELDRALAALDRAERIPCPELIRNRIAKVATTFRSGYWMTVVLEQDKLGDPTSLKWLTMFAYFAATGLCVTVVCSQQRSQSLGQPATPLFWMLVTVLLIGLWVNRYADLQTFLIDVGRKFASTQSWYQTRQNRIVVFTAIATLGGTATLSSVWWLARRQWKRNLPVLLGTALLCGFLLIQSSSFDHADRPSSFHQFDATFREYFYGLSCRWVAELSGLVIVAVGATRSLKSRSTL